MKKCSKCGLTKPTTEFYRYSKVKCGLYPSCKLCKTAQNKAFNALDVEGRRRRGIIRQARYLQNPINKLIQNLRSRLTKLCKGTLKSQILIKSIGCTLRCLASI